MEPSAQILSLVVGIDSGFAPVANATEISERSFQITNALAYQYIPVLDPRQSGNAITPVEQTTITGQWLNGQIIYEPSHKSYLKSITQASDWYCKQWHNVLGLGEGQPPPPLLAQLIPDESLKNIYPRVELIPTQLTKPFHHDGSELYVQSLFVIF